MALFFVVDNWMLVLHAVLKPAADNWNALGEAFWAAVHWPIDVGLTAFTRPEAILLWLKERVVASNGSMFELATLLFPGFFWVIGVVLAFAGLGGGDKNPEYGAAG